MRGNREPEIEEKEGRYNSLTEPRGPEDTAVFGSELVKKPRLFDLDGSENS